MVVQELPQGILIITPASDYGTNHSWFRIVTVPVVDPDIVGLGLKCLELKPIV